LTQGFERRAAAIAVRVRVRNPWLGVSPFGVGSTDNQNNQNNQKGTIIMRRVLASVVLASLALGAMALAGCEQVADMAATAKKEAVKVAGDLVDTQTACTLAGQNEAFCGCLQTELGPRIEPAHLDAIVRIARETLTGGGVEKAVDGAASMDQKTKDALVKCSVRGAIGGAVEGEGGGG
jgi:hypothetical protein